MQATGEGREAIAPDPSIKAPGDAEGREAGSPPAPPSAAPEQSPVPGGGNDGVTGLPGGFPVQPLGQHSGKFHFLTSRGELVDLAAGALAHRSNLMALMVGVPDAIAWLASIGEPSRRDVGFNAQKAADRLMMACSALPLFDPQMSIRHFGTWRGDDGSPVMHLGEAIECGAATPRRGRVICGALYPTVPSGKAPGRDAASSDDIRFVRDRIGRFWAWGSDTTPDVLIGWIGQAVLGQYPRWRTHMWIKGKLGSGKTSATEIISSMLGGMSSGVRQTSTAAAIRQTTNRQAIARIFDEAESDGTGRMEEVISLFRLMSDATGAQVERGTSDHTGIKFQLYGAGLMASIIPGIMTPADRSRFVIVDLAELPQKVNPADAAIWLAELKADAHGLGPGVWRRMIDLAPGRWDVTFDVYSALVQGFGARARSGDTIGAILAGWDLMLFDTALVDADGQKDEARLALAQDIARPLVLAAIHAEDEGEGERCLRAIMAYFMPKDHGGVISIGELVARLVNEADKPNTYDQRLIGRMGLRVLDGKRGERELFVANGQHPIMDRALAGTRWRGGGHRAALDTLAGVRPAPQSIRIACGPPMRGAIIPNKFLPGDDVDDGGSSDYV